MNVAQLIKQAILRGLYHRFGIYNLLPDYSYLIQGQWANSVDFPITPAVFTGEGAVTKASGNRTKAGDTDKKNVAFSLFVTAITEEAEARYMSDGELARNVIADAVDSLGDKLDAAVMAKFATGIPAAQQLTAEGAVIDWPDLVALGAKAREIKSTPKGLLYIVPPALEAQVKNVDVIKLAMANNANYLETGVAKVDNNYYAFTGNVPEVEGEDAIIAVNLALTGKATKKWMDRKEAYDQDTADSYIDYLTYAAFDKLRSQAVLSLKPNA